ncbi:hypothetical protein [Streptomyces chartreusis]|uniref:hypothetical protein n=1 Tax=Streptomyces chartreusis TaxID=1969 RepID=UPI003D74826A
MGPQTVRPTYPRIPQTALAAAQLLARATRREADTRTGRVVCHAIAARVRDILTDHHDDHPFDAVLVEIVQDPNGTVQLTGRYWTADRTTGQLDLWDVYELNEWTACLGDANRHVWKPLCELISDADGTVVYRFDLVRAAHGPLDVVELPAEAARIKEAHDRLHTALPRPWRTRQTLHTPDGGTHAEETESAYISVEVIAANGLRVAELGATLEDIEDQHERRSVLDGVRADAELIARGPQDIAYLLSQLAQAQDLLTRTQR